jgi:hypothetical protein
MKCIRSFVVVLTLVVSGCAGSGWQPSSSQPSGGAPYTGPCNATG